MQLLLLLVLAVVPPVWWVIATAIGAVLASTGALIWIMLRAARIAERSERDLTFRRRLLFGIAAIYAGSTILAIVRVMIGSEPLEFLLGLPIGLLFIYWFVKAGIATNNDPSSRTDQKRN